MIRSPRAIAMALVLAIGCWGGAAAAQVQSQYEQGVAARLDGRNEEAARLLTAWLVEHPDDVDARLQLAYADLARGRLGAAEAGFRAVITASPDYSDARDGLAMVAARRREGVQATTIGFEGALSTVSGGASDWQELGLNLASPVGLATTVEGRATWYERFGVEDIELGALLTTRAAENLWLRAGVSGTPDSDFRPKIGLTGGFDWRLSAGDRATVLTFDARYEDFPSQSVVTVSPGIVQYVAGDRAWLTARAFGVTPHGQAMRVGFLVRGDVEPAEHMRLFAGFAEGPDTDLGIVTDVTSLFGGVEVPLGERFSLTGGVSREMRDGPADRTEFRLGLRARL